jgi:hypothetical protein
LGIVLRGGISTGTAMLLKLFLSCSAGEELELRGQKGGGADKAGAMEESFVQQISARCSLA